MKQIYKQPDLTVDIMILTDINKDMKILLIKRKRDPFKNLRAIPGGYLDIPEKWGEGETLEQAAYRELKEETSLSSKDLDGTYLKQFRTYSNPKRDPRGRVVSVVFYAYIEDNKKLLKSVKAGDDAKDARWFSLKKLPKKMAFDHLTIINDFIKFNPGLNCGTQEECL